MVGGATIPLLPARWKPRHGRSPRFVPRRRTPLPAEACATGTGMAAEAQLADGSWPPYPGQPAGCWVTSVASHALLLQGGEARAPWSAASLASERRGRPKGRSGGGCAKACFLPAWLARTARCAAGIGRRGRPVGLNLPPMRFFFCARCPRSCFLPRRRNAGNWRNECSLTACARAAGGTAATRWSMAWPGVPRIGPTAWALLALRDHAERAEIR